MSQQPFQHPARIQMGSGKSGKFYSLPALGKALGVNTSRLPVSLRVVLESVLRHCAARKSQKSTSGS